MWEIQEILEALREEEEDFTTRAEDMFSVLDRNGDGLLEEDEFVKGCMEDKELLARLMNGGTEFLVAKDSESWDIKGTLSLCKNF